jgi:hypothetical protein
LLFQYSHFRWGFEHDNVYIRYCIKVPSLWSVAPDSVMESTSQISRALVQPQPIGAADSSSQHIWRWSLPFSFAVGKSRASSHSSATLTDRPRIEFQVISYDSWDRARVLGLATISIPAGSGAQQQVRLAYYHCTDLILLYITSYCDNAPGRAAVVALGKRSG